jgi:hypothetical protein
MMIGQQRLLFAPAEKLCGSAIGGQLPGRAGAVVLAESLDRKDR